MRKPEQRDIVLSRSDSVGVVWGLRPWQIRGNQVGRRSTILTAVTRNREEAIWIDWRLPVLGGDHDQRGVEETLFFQLTDPLADGSVHQLNFIQQEAGWSSGCVKVATGTDVLLNQLLPDADGLEVHTEHRRYRSAPLSIVGLAIDFVQDGIYLESVVALNVLKTIGVGGEIRFGIGDGSAVQSQGRDNR